MSLMFTPTPKIKEAVLLINSLDTERFPLILTRILQKLHLKDEHAFSEKEEEKLQSALGLDASKVELVLETSEFVLQQAAYHTAKPAVLTQQLNNLELQEDKVSMFVDTWASQARSVVEKLRQRSLAPNQLEDVKWRLHLKMASANQTKLKEPCAIFDLGIRNQDTQKKESVMMEFNHEQLYAFYNKLEVIQSQIDNLS